MSESEEKAIRQEQEREKDESQEEKVIKKVKIRPLIG